MRNDFKIQIPQSIVRSNKILHKTTYMTLCGILEGSIVLVR
ncbi:hypothetical protein QFZ28_003969 [Neobacillus niacini]|nr:hypothetical protein [Neobacillus niacini]